MECCGYFDCTDRILTDSSCCVDYGFWMSMVTRCEYSLDVSLEFFPPFSVPPRARLMGDIHGMYPTIRHCQSGHKQLPAGR